MPRAGRGHRQLWEGNSERVGVETHRVCLLQGIWVPWKDIKDAILSHAFLLFLLDTNSGLSLFLPP